MRLNMPEDIRSLSKAEVARRESTNIICNFLSLINKSCLGSQKIRNFKGNTMNRNFRHRDFIEIYYFLHILIIVIVDFLRYG
jgi:hypothetical protein